MSGDSEIAPQVRRLSRRLLLISLLTTVLIAVGGSVLMWFLYGSLLYGPDAAPDRELAQSADPLVVGIGRTPGGAIEWRAYASAFSQLGRDLDRPIVLRYALSHPEIEELVRTGKVDIALVPIYVYLNLETTDSARLVAAPVVGGTSRETAALVVAGQSRFESLADLEGGRLALTQRSIAGVPFARWLLKAESPDEFFGSVTQNDSQDLDLSQVHSGAADAACIGGEALAAWPAGDFRVLAQSPTFAMPPLVARPDLDDATVRTIRQSLVQMDVDRLGISGTSVSGFVAVRPADYDFPRLMAESERSPALDGQETQ
ncbi:MAG TPA: PhnD/SsuA/transferrin family substrate-binding protein [Coriobacteriia bacterium]|nr:PhnD/SsuA/transferrin family substrate-binding protein [Coriobacteriia bacterium]